MGVERTTPRERMLKQGVVIFLLTILVIAFLSLEVQILLETKACNDFENMVPSTNYGNMNHTLCSYIKQFKLSEDKRVSICVYQKELRIDFRRFVSNKPSIRGLWMTKQEWRSLLRLWGLIQTSIAEAEKQ